MAINQIYYGNTELINLQNDTITAADVCNQKTFHLRDGTIAQGTNTYDADTSDGNAIASNILLNKTAYVNGNKITGTMPDNGSMAAGLSTKTAAKIIPAGYTSGGTVSILTSEQNKIISENIRTGINILGVSGSFPDYTTFPLQGQSFHTGFYTTPAGSSTKTLPLDAVNLNGRELQFLYVFLYGSTGLMGISASSSSSISNFCITALSWTKNNLYLNSSNQARQHYYYAVKPVYSSFKASVSVSSSAAASNFTIENLDKLSSGEAYVYVSASNVVFYGNCTYLIVLGG